MTAIARKLLNQKDEAARLPIPREQTINQYVAAKIAPYVGKSNKDIATELQVTALPTAKSYNSSLTLAMLGTSRSSISAIEQFSKANINQFKSVTIYPNGLPKEHMSFPAITDEQWEEWANPDTVWEQSYL